MFVTSLPKISGLLRMLHIEKCVTEDLSRRVFPSAIRQSNSPYSSNVMPPFPTSSMSRSFQRPGPAFWPTGAAKSIIRDIAQSSVSRERPAKSGEEVSELTESRKLAVYDRRAWTTVVEAIEVLRVRQSGCGLVTYRKRDSRP